MVEVTLDNIVPATPPTNGWIVGYRKKGTLGAYIIPLGSPFSGIPIVFNTTDPAGTLYEGYIKANCGYAQSLVFNWETPCDCIGSGYIPSPEGTQCEQTTIIAATVTNSGYCLTSSVNTAYGNYGSRIYNTGFSLATLMLAQYTASPYIYGSMSLATQWSNPTQNTTASPMNREGVWIDSDCNGNKDSLTAGTKVTVAAMYNNTGTTRTIFMGVGADNQFKIVVNGIVIVDTLSTASTNQFKIWHIIPIVIKPGVNFFNIIGTGDGSINDSLAMVLYNNTAAQIYAATSDAQLNIIYKSSSVRGTTFDVATCPATYSLDSSGGSGSYVCTKVTTKVCNSAT